MLDDHNSKSFVLNEYYFSVRLSLELGMCPRRKASTKSFRFVIGGIFYIAWQFSSVDGQN